MNFDTVNIYKINLIFKIVYCANCKKGKFDFRLTTCFNQRLPQLFLYAGPQIVRAASVMADLLSIHINKWSYISKHISSHSVWEAFPNPLAFKALVCENLKAAICKFTESAKKFKRTVLNCIK